MFNSELEIICLQVAVYHLSLSLSLSLSNCPPSPIDLSCWSPLCLPLACPSPSSGGLCGPFYIGIHITLKRSPPCRLSLSDRPSHRLGLLVADVSPTGSPFDIARKGASSCKRPPCLPTTGYHRL